MNRTNTIRAALLLITLTLLFVLHSFIFMQGDDFFFGTLTQNGFGRFWYEMAKHYMEDNGRAIINFLTALILIPDIHLFRLLNPILIIGTIFMTTELAAKGKNPIAATVAGILLFSLISIDVTRQSVYWLTGSMNYLYPSFMIMSTYRLVRKSRLTGKKYRFLPLLGFIAGAAVEQSGAMLIGILLLDMACQKFIAKEKPAKTEISTFAAAAIGFLTVVLSPGTGARIGIETKTPLWEVVSSSFLLLAKFNVKNHPMPIFNALLCLCAIYWLVKYKHAAHSILASFLALCLPFYLWAVYVPYTGAHRYAAAAFFTINCLSLIYVSALMMLREKEPMPLLFTLAAFGAQLMMLFSPVLGERNLLPSVLAYFAVIVYTVQRLNLSAPKLKYCAAAILATLFAFSCFNITKDITGYKQNAAIHKYNIGQIHETRERNALLRTFGPPSPLCLKQASDEQYHWSPPYANPFHHKMFRLYYGLESVKVEFK